MRDMRNTTVDSKYGLQRLQFYTLASAPASRLKTSTTDLLQYFTGKSLC